MILVGYLFQYLYICFLQKINKKRYIGLPIIIGTIFSLLLLFFDKGNLVGTDYVGYKRNFEFYLTQRQIPEFYIKDSGWGVMVYFYTIGKVIEDFKGAVFLLILFENYIIYQFLKKYSYKRFYYFSFLTYFSFFYIHNTFNIMKQMVAICIFSLGMKYIVEKKFFKYIVCIVIATLFHTLSIVLLPFYYFFNNKIKTRNIIIIFFICLGIIIFLKNNIMLVGDLFSSNRRYYQYFLGRFKSVHFNILNFFEVYIPLIFMFILDYKYKLRKKSRKNRIFINFYYSYCFLYLITIVDKMMGVRFAFFLSLGFSVIYPYIFYLIFRYLKLNKIYYIFYPLWMLIFLYFRHFRILLK